MPVDQQLFPFRLTFRAIMYGLTVCRIHVSPILLIVFLLTQPASGDDWTQWRGNQRDGKWNESGIVDVLTASFSLAMTMKFCASMFRSSPEADQFNYLNPNPEMIL